MKLGQVNSLEILRETSVGLFLGDDKGNDVLLPNKFVPLKYEIGDKLEVFLFLDSDERLTATTQIPKIRLNEFAILEVKMVTKIGAFVDWGLDKQLLVPFREQSTKLQEGQKDLFYMYIDGVTNRLVASSRINAFLSKDEPSYKPGEEVGVLFYKETDIGWQVIVDNKFKGMVYHSNLFKNIRIGNQTMAYVLKVREDFKIDLTLQKQGYKHVEDEATKILNTLRINGGFLDLTDKSSPEEIYKRLNISKKAFKKAIGNLYKKRTISIESNGIKLVE